MIGRLNTNLPVFRFAVSGFIFKEVMRISYVNEEGLIKYYYVGKSNLNRDWIEINNPNHIEKLDKLNIKITDKL